MKSWPLIAAIMQLGIGIAAVAAYTVIAISGEPLGRWTVTLILAVAFTVLGAIGIADRIKENRRSDK